MRISVGCNCRCSYYIVDGTPVREGRRPLQEPVAEVEQQVADGVREVTLLGQNVNSYGRDLPTPRSFSELLPTLGAIHGLHRIRRTSPHPEDMREDAIRRHAKLPNVSPHIHLPL
jgi:tRNA-2-methylthio-N6-dimethylallyladenosine synthase